MSLRSLFLMGIVSLLSLSAQSQPTEHDLWKMFQAKIPDGVIKYNGYYNNVTFAKVAKAKGEEMYKSIGYTDAYHKSDSVSTNPVYFFKNGVIMQSPLTATTNELCKKIKTDTSYIKDRLNNYNCGAYCIKGDTIEALIYLAYRCCFIPRYKLRLTKFRGIIVNKDTITDWVAVPPFPKEYYKDTDEFKFEHATMVFTQFDDKQYIDSTRVWVNKFRNPANTSYSHSKNNP